MRGANDMSERSILLIHVIITQFGQFSWIVEMVCSNEFLPCDVYVCAFVINDVDFVIYFLVRDSRVI